MYCEMSLSHNELQAIELGTIYLPDLLLAQVSTKAKPIFEMTTMTLRPVALCIREESGPSFVPHHSKGFRKQTPDLEYPFTEQSVRVRLKLLGVKSN